LIVAFDTWILGTSRRCDGYHVYAKRLLLELERILQTYSGIEICPFILPGFSNDANDFIGSTGLKPVRSESLGSHPYLWWAASAQLSSRKINADLLFCPTPRILPSGLVPTVTMIADTTPLRIPSMIKRRGFLDRAFLNVSSRLSEKIVTISECSKRDIVEFYGIKPEKIAVTYLSFDRTIFNREPAPQAQQQALFQRLGIRRPFIVHHGSVHIRKNLIRLIEAYSSLLERRRSVDCDLVLVGTNAWGHQQILEAAQRVKHGRVIVTGPLPDEDLAMILKGASAEVIPSLYEGFCLPMLEAMACGTPTITSNNSCLPEVSGNTLRYFDPLSIEDVSARIEDVLCDSALRLQISSAGLKRASEFSWTKCARETLMTLIDSYQKVSGRTVRAPDLPSVEGTTSRLPMMNAQ